MEADSSHLSRGVTAEQDPEPAPATDRNDDQTSERVRGSELMVAEGDYLGLHQLLDQIHGIASPILQFTLQWKDIDEQYTSLENLLKERTMEVELKERSVVERIVELEKKEELLKEVEEREKKIDSLEKSMALRLEEKEEENEVKQYLVSSVMRLVCETANEEVADELEELNNGKSCELDKAVKEFDLKQKEWIKNMSKEAEVVKESLKQLEVKEKEVKLLDEAIKEKVVELEKKENIFEVELKAKAAEMEVKEKKLEEREKELELKQRQLEEGRDKLKEREKELELKQRELGQLMGELKERELQEQAETCKRSRVQLLTVKRNEADSLIPPAKKHKSHCHDDADKETNPAWVVSASASSPQRRDKAYEDKTVEEPKEIKITDSEFYDFKKTMSSFVVDKIWALYDPKDDMPRLYGRIKRITKCRLTLDVTWLNPKGEESVPVACGRFTYGRTETVSHLTFSHELKPIIHGRNISMNPKEGETWALFRDWSQSWENNPRQHKPPYRYDLVEVLVGFEDHRGVGVTYLGKVEAFVSVFKQAAQHGVFQRLILPSEMHRFSHRVPSVRLNGEEKEGVPAGSFELDPAAVPSYILLGDKEPEVVRVSSAKDVPLLILD